MMHQTRLVTLLVGHTLARGLPLGAALRSLPMPRAREAGALAEAGRLEPALEKVGMDPDLARLAVRSPAAVVPATARLGRLPSPLTFHTVLFQTLTYFLVIAFVQAMVLALLQVRFVPLMEEMGSTHFGALGALSFVPVLFLLAPVPLGAWLLRSRSRLLSWQVHLARAREAALAAALWDAGAPPEDRLKHHHGCTALQGAGATLRELEMIQAWALASAEASHKRFMVALQVGGYALLILVALATTLAVYQAIVSIPSVP